MVRLTFHAWLTAVVYFHVLIMQAKANLIGTYNSESIMLLFAIATIDLRTCDRFPHTANECILFK